jgi:hypothetical protein
LPDAIDLMGRALRAGHAFPTALKMVGDEMAEPVGAEFRTLFDETNYGVSMQNALLNLVARVPSTDLQYFVVAVLIQRETGGNLAELLDNISAIVRDRLKLMGQIRTLSAEGRLSAWILGLLPFATAALINLVNPGFMKVLWEDPIGPNRGWGADADGLGVVDATDHPHPRLMPIWAVDEPFRRGDTRSDQLMSCRMTLAQIAFLALAGASASRCSAWRGPAERSGERLRGWRRQTKGAPRTAGSGARDECRGAAVVAGRERNSRGCANAS